MKTRITLVGARLSLNLGGPSLLEATKTALAPYFTDAEYTLIIPWKTIAEDEKLAPKYGVKILPFKFKLWTLPMLFMKRVSGFTCGPKDQKDYLASLKNADIVIDIWGIMYADTLNPQLIYRFTDGLHLGIAKLFGKPVIKYTAALGPFTDKWNRLFAKFYLGKHCNLVLARDTESFNNLINLGITTRSKIIPDTAFLLPAQSSPKSIEIAEIRKTKPVVCLSVSYQAFNRERKPGAYVQTMKILTEHIIHTTGAKVILLPNELAKSANDDTKVALKILNQLNTQECILTPTENLLAQEIKGIIRECDIVVAARYHSIVASLSLGIPTLAIGWHHKYLGVLSLFEQTEWLCNIEELTDAEVTEKFDALWLDRENIRKTIAAHVPGVKEQILEGGKLVKEVMDNRKSGF